MEKDAAGYPQGHTNPGTSRTSPAAYPTCKSGSEGGGWKRDDINRSLASRPPYRNSASCAPRAPRRPEPRSLGELPPFSPPAAGID